MTPLISRLAAILAASLALFLSPAHAQEGGSSALGEVSEAICSGRMINPITDVCWDCMFPITVGSIPVVPSSRPDTENPSSPLCTCPAPPPLFLRVGLSIGWWEPSRLADVTMQPYCFPNLGGFVMPGVLPRGHGRAARRPA